jgi:hypothetical protein
MSKTQSTMVALGSVAPAFELVDVTMCSLRSQTMRGQMGRIVPRQGATGCW